MKLLNCVRNVFAGFFPERIPAICCALTKKAGAEAPANITFVSVVALVFVRYGSL